MKLKSILATAIAVVSVFGADKASAAYACSLSVNPSSVILPGHFFTYSIDVVQMPEVGPFIPAGPPPFIVMFHGSKDGIQDIPDSGEIYPATIGVGNSILSGYYNPGDLQGYYERHATLYSSTFPYSWSCQTNSVNVVLLGWQCGGMFQPSCDTL